MLTGLFQVCAKQNCSSVSHWFDIILTIHVSKHMRFFLSKLWVFYCCCFFVFFCFFFFVFFFFLFCFCFLFSFFFFFFLFLLFFCCCFFVNLDKQTLDIGVLRKKNYSLFLDYTFDMNNCYMYLFLLRKQIK